MKFLHTSDWHIGRTLNNISLLEEQKHILNEIERIAKEQKVDGIILAGDIYDRMLPSLDATQLLDEVISNIIIDSKIPVYAITGNHDSARRMNFGTTFFKRNNFYLNTNIEDAIKPIELEDTQIFLLPFFDPLDARIYLSQIGEDDETIKSYKKIGDYIERIIVEMKKNFDPNKKHILVTHFAVTKTGETPEEFKEALTSETTSTVGGLATINPQIFDDFDYVALGHIHTRTASPSKAVVYSGAPMIYNTDEAKLKQTKGIFIIDTEKDDLDAQFIEIKPNKEIIKIVATYDEIMDETFYREYKGKNAWFAFEIIDYDTKEMEGINVRANIERIYGNDIIEINIKEKNNETDFDRTSIEVTKLSEEELISDFYKRSTNKDLSDYQVKLVEELLVDIRREG